jgi:hypothetical protein
VSPQNDVRAKYWMWIPLICSTVLTRSGGPPMAIDALILFVPWPGIETYESRGMPMITACRFFGSISIRWIESASPRSGPW